MKKNIEEKKTNLKKQTKKTLKKETNKKTNVFTKIEKYLKEVKAEMKKVKWATKDNLFQFSLITLTFIFIFALYFGLLDIIIAAIKAGLR